MTLVLRAMLLALLATGCSKARREDAATQAAAPPQVSLVKVSEEQAPPAPPPVAYEATPAPGQAAGAQMPAPEQVRPATPPRMLARTGTARIEVKSLEPGVRAVRALATRFGAYIQSEEIQAGGKELKQASLQLKVPSERFDQAMQALPSIGRVEMVQVTGEDVGQQYVDVNARLANAKRLEQRLLELLSTRTGRLEDVLAVERELARVREEIDRYTAGLQYLQSRVNLSTLVINLHEPEPLGGGTPGSNPVVHAFGQAWRNFVGFVAGFIASLGILLPLAVLVFAAWWVFRRVRRRRVPRSVEEPHGPDPDLK